MIFSPRVQRYLASVKFDKKFIASRKSILRFIAAFLSLCLLLYLVWLSISSLFGAVSYLVSHHPKPIKVLLAGADTLQHFTGNQGCAIKQTDLYLAPLSTNPKLSPFCPNRASLLEALSNGGRHGHDEPYVGKGCHYRWFSTAEICMVLERFNAVVFVGDDIARSLYLAFNIMLREDLVLGGLESWNFMSDQDRESCTCDKQFSDECNAYGVKSSEEVKRYGRSGQGGSAYYCERIPHAYIPVDTVPASPSAMDIFKDLTYLKPNPWQPSPVIFSFGHASSFDIEMATAALDEWLALALAAERNIPLLFLSPPAIDSPDSNTAVWQFHQRMSTVVKQKHVDVLGLYNLTLQATSMDSGQHFGEKVALVEVMMVINWLSKLETS